MDLRQLRYFVAVAEARNFTRAAQQLNIAQPPLSRRIQQLEREVGAELIDRGVRPLRLTTAGSLFYEQAAQVLGRLEEMRTMVGRTNRSGKRRFVMGFVASTIYARLPQIIRAFRAEAPDVELSLIEIVSLDQVSALKEGRIDVGFGRIRFEDDAVRRTVLREERLVVALPAAHGLGAEAEPLPLRRVAEGTLILYPRAPRPSYADQVLGHLRDQGLKPRSIQEVRELQIAIGLVAAEEGLCIVPESIRRSRTEDVVYRDLAEPVTSPIIMSYRAGDRSPEIRLIARILSRLYTAWGYAVPEGLQPLVE